MGCKISILISIFNGEKTLSRCFISLKNQSYQNFKIICLDDASTDSTAIIIRKWQNYFGKERFCFLKNETNSGVAKSSNKGLTKINTEYTCRIDADDWWHPQKLEKQLEFIENNKTYGVVGCNYINVENGNENKVLTEESDEDIRNVIIKKNPFAHSCIIFSTKIAQEFEGYNENKKYGSDYDFLLRFFQKTKYYNIQEFLCYRERLTTGISIKNQREQMIQGIKTKIKYINLYRLPVINYIYLIEPLLLILTPNVIKIMKRKFFS